MKHPHVIEALEIIDKVETKLNKKMNAAQKKIDKLETTVEQLKNQLEALIYRGKFST